MSLIKTVKVTVLADSKMVFQGEPVYRIGEVYYGVVDLNTDVAIVSFKFGNQVIDAKTVKDLALQLTGDIDYEKDPKYKSISQYLKSITINKWANDNVKGIYEIYSIRPSKGIQVTNNVSGYGGSEHLTLEHNLLAVKLVNSSHDFMTQIRKGSIFYLEDNTVFSKQELELDALSYEVLKEIKFIIENDYKYRQ